jgi:hypothetical protein
LHMLRNRSPYSPCVMFSAKMTSGSDAVNQDIISDHRWLAEKMVACASESLSVSPGSSFLQK